MIIGNIGSPVVVVESQDPYSFCQECEQVKNYATNSSSYYKIDRTHMDNYMYKAMFVMVDPEGL